MDARDYCNAALQGVFDRLAGDMRAEGTVTPEAGKRFREGRMEIANAVAAEIEKTAELLRRGNSCKCGESTYRFIGGVMRVRVEVWEFTCERCSHKWVERDAEINPKRCPACKSPQWHKPRKKGKGQV